MISIQRNSLATSGTYSVVEVDRGRLEYIRRGEVLDKSEFLDEIQMREHFSKFFWIHFMFIG